MVVAVEDVLAEEITGKFCRLLGPESASPESLALTPSRPRSMPNSPFEKMELERTLLPALDVPMTASMFTPLDLLKAMVLGLAPPKVLPDLNTPTPSPLPRAFVPVLSVPMRLLCTWLLLEPSWTPLEKLPEIRLRSAGVVPPIVLLVELKLVATPSAWLGTASVPMKLPEITLLVLPATFSNPI